MWQVADPASRDQDQKVPRRDRFSERIRRTWFQVPQSVIAGAEDEEDLVQRIAQCTGDDAAHVRERLAWFAYLEQQGARPRRDKMIRPGAPSDAPPPRIRRP